MLAEFVRLVLEGLPDWFLMENVPAVPDLEVPNYTIQRLDIDGRECGLRQRRLRHFQFGSLGGSALSVPRLRIQQPAFEPAALASEGMRPGRRNWDKFCALQGTEPIELPGMTLGARYKAVGNGVPVPMARMLARAIAQWSQEDAPRVIVCGCGCGRPLGDNGQQQYALPSCRKRMQRRRDAAGVAQPPRSVTA